MCSEKAALRKRFKALRNGLNPEDRSRWSATICELISKFAHEKRFDRIGAFWPYGSEVDLRPLVSSHPDWIFLFPKVVSTDPPRLAWGSEPLEPGLFGLQEPIIAQHLMPPVQLLLVPGLAFDGHGFRLGYGGGFYDALLARIDENITMLAAGFDAQVCDNLPVSPQDMPVDGMVSETGIRWFNRA